MPIEKLSPLVKGEEDDDGTAIIPNFNFTFSEKKLNPFHTTGNFLSVTAENITKSLVFS